MISKLRFACLEFNSLSTIYRMQTTVAPLSTATSRPFFTPFIGCLQPVRRFNYLKFSCQTWEYIKPIILHERRARLTDYRTREKKQFREFPTAVKGIMYKIDLFKVKNHRLLGYYAPVWYSM